MKNFTIFKTKPITSFLVVAFFCGFLFAQILQAGTPTVVVTFRVDMTYQFEKGSFNPFTDSLDITGTMNSWAGSPKLSPVGSTQVYECSYTLDTSSIQQYQFRIKGLHATDEFTNGYKRMYRVPAQADTVNSDFADYNPGTVPMTFKCNMSYQMKMGRFNKLTDYVDFAGDINNWGADYDVLFDRGNDSIYEFNINVDTSYYVNQVKIQFKFRMNGSIDETVPNRIARVQDTIDGFKNIVEVWYNDQDPAVPAAPFAYDLAILGNLSVADTITGSYTYEDVNGDLEGASIYRWFRADSLTQPVPDTIPGINSDKYKVAVADSGKFIGFEVIPVALTGEYPVGEAVTVWSDVKVVNTLGISGNKLSGVKFYPNPVRDVVYIDTPVSVDRIEIYNLMGQQVVAPVTHGQGRIVFNTGDLRPGVYFIRISNSGDQPCTLKFIKN